MFTHRIFPETGSRFRVRCSSAGFTLIEVIVALALVTLAIPVVGRLLATNIKGTIKVEERATLVAAYRTLEASLVDRTRLMPGTQSGTIGKTAWSIVVREFGEAEGEVRGNRTWIPLYVATTLRTPSGETLHIDSIRLGKRGAS